MNSLSLSLSWLIYASDVIPSIGRMFAVFAFLLAGFLIGYTIFFIDYNEPRYLKFYWKSGLFIFAFLSLTATLLPSRDTILLIAGSEIGEKVIETEVGQQSIRILKNKLSEIELEQTRKKAQ